MHTYTRWRNPSPYTRKINDKDMVVFVLLVLFWWLLLIGLVLHDLVRVLVISQRKSGRGALRALFVRFPVEVVLAFFMVAWYLGTYWKKVTG